MKRILSIDGGGIRGIIPAMIMHHLEVQQGLGPLAKRFDLIAGTSTGSILALGLTRPESATTREPHYSAQDLLNLYLQRGKDIFARSFWKGVSSVWGVSDEMYDYKPLEGILKEYFQEFAVKDAVTDVLIPSYDIERRQPQFFKSWQSSNTRDIPMWQAARASSAAPTYFEPIQLTIEGVPSAFIDGGVFANNPAMCAYAEARRQWPDEEQFLVLSLGTGHHTRRIPYEQAKDWGKLEWMVPILNVVFDGVSETVDYQLEHLLPKECYFRLDRPLAAALDDMDNASQSNMIALQQEAANLLQEQREQIGKLVAALSAPPGPAPKRAPKGTP
jgi:patatin-like phospholipase/acyl hydrolase